MTISQLVPFARSAGLGATAATLALTVGAFGNAGGRILSAGCPMRWAGCRRCGSMVLVSAVAMPVAVSRARAGACCSTCSSAVVYWCYGTQLSVFASTTADFYGTKNLGMNYGVLFTAWGAAGILGPAIAARVFDAVRRLPVRVLHGRGAGAGRVRVAVDGKATGANGDQLTRAGGQDGPEGPSPQSLSHRA